MELLDTSWISEFVSIKPPKISPKERKAILHPNEPKNSRPRSLQTTPKKPANEANMHPLTRAKTPFFFSFFSGFRSQIFHFVDLCSMPFDIESQKSNFGWPK